MEKEKKDENTLIVVNFFRGIYKLIASLPNFASLFPFRGSVFVSKKENNSKKKIGTTSSSGKTVTTGSLSNSENNSKNKIYTTRGSVNTVTTGVDKLMPIETQEIAPQEQKTASVRAFVQEAKNRGIVENDKREVENDEREDENAKREIYQDAIERYYSYNDTNLDPAAIQIKYGLEELNLSLGELQELEKILQGKKTNDVDNPPLKWLESNNIFIKRQGPFGPPKYEIPKNRHSPFVMNMLTLAVLNEYGQMMVSTFGTPNESVSKKHRLQCLKAFIHQKEMEPNRDFRNDIRNMIDFIYNSNKDTIKTINRMMREGGRKARFTEVKEQKKVPRGSNSSLRRGR